MAATIAGQRMPVAACSARRRATVSCVSVSSRVAQLEQNFDPGEFSVPQA
jgi:hypothetical protein